MTASYSIAIAGRYTYRLPRRRGGYFRLYWCGAYIGRRRSLAELRDLARIHDEMVRKGPPVPDADPRQLPLPLDE